jgi:NitT/TauT family transport system substrate-binding protein
MERRTLLLILFLLYGATEAWSQAGFQKVKITMPSRSIAFIDVFVAHDRGFFRQEGLEADLVQARPDIAIAGLMAGEVDADTAAGGAAQASQRGMPIKLAAVTLYRPLFWLVTKPEYKSIAQLKGSTLGVTSLNGIQHQTAARLLRTGGLDPTKDVNTVVIGGAPTLLSALVSGSIQVTALSPPTIIVARDKFNMKIMAEPPKDVIALQSGFAVAEKSLVEKRDLVRRMMRARAKANKYVQENERGASETLAKYMKLEPPMIVESYRLARFGFSKDGILTDKEAEELLREDAKILGLSQVVPASKVFDFSIQREVNKELGIH